MRRAAVAGLFLAILAAGLLWRHARLRPSPALPPGPDAAILKDLDAQESLRLRALHRDVSAEIAAAAQRGAPVGGLQKLADAALALDRRGQRAQAFERLNRLRLLIPQKSPLNE